MRIEELKNLIDNSITRVSENGWSIEPGMWVSIKQKCCCPLGAIVVDKCGNDRFAMIEADQTLPLLLGMMSDEIYSFADGFDCQPYDKNKHVFKLWMLGRDYAKRYKFTNDPPPTIPEKR